MRFCSVTLCLFLVLAEGSPAAANAPELHEARLALMRYDLGGDKTLKTMRSLRALADYTLDPAHREEALFLRAMVATDLLVIAARREDPSLRQLAARSYETTERELVDRIQNDLQALRSPLYQESRADALAALAIFRGHKANITKQTPGLRSDLLYLQSLRETFRRSSSSMEALASLEHDPCAAASTCAIEFAHFDPEGRRGVYALHQAGAALGRIELAIQGGDPLSHALQETIAADRQVLAGMVLRPLPYIPASWNAVPAGPRARALKPVMTMMLSPGELRYGWAPEIRLDKNGKLAFSGLGEPLLPHTKTLKIENGEAPVFLKIQSLNDFFANLPEFQGSLAITTSPEVSAIMLSRVLLSVREAGKAWPQLIGRGPDGSPRGIDIQVAQQATHSSALEVRVRLGGFAVKAGRSTEVIPRIRDEQGLHFDLEALQKKIARRGKTQASALSFMSPSLSGPVVTTAFHIAPPEQPLTLLLR